MNHFVPVFGIDEDHSIPSSSGLHRHDDEVSELLWRNGQLVVQSQNQRLQRKSPPPPLPEDDSMPWLHFPIEDPPPFDPDLADLFSFPPPPPPPIHHRREAILSDSVPIASSGNHEVRDSAVKSVVSESPAVRLKPNFPAEIADRGNLFRESLIGAEGSGIRRNSTVGLSREADTYDLTLTSSLGGSVSASDRKRKGREHDAASTECQSEDVWIESYEPKKQSHGANTKRSRAAEVHNRSERRRRDRINEKMKVLQALIPSSSKTDKSSMLDEAIEYLKSLQMQVQMMMSMGCGMVPMMFPGIQQQYMGMRMAQQMMSFPGVLPGSAMQTSGAPSQLDPRFPFQPFQMPSIPVGTGPSSIQQASNQGEFNMAGIPSPFDPYQQCPGIQQTPLQIPRTNQTRFTNQVQTEEAKTKTL